ncbi:TPA: dihydrodipicolinate synthase family protein [Candidatus Poribacteria bacterium]|nr:dihydrodipicolinate synthase family protein [Candidatus Poribacteria bacterium]HIA67726.1 dihydrodipicolinate synthase family protein [Candidatus Poribacteria bacterium]HIB87314.1 dihydrodipicolinate synthase family protein [Candidatus Poribacteria bacterium]HIB98884.1 dihydrodipicolinate synthase family protein [Candidatus Poribacteria bacterium]HIM11901.1 dihydrodipicolinate synthase family protein [Candidatus Poribacteria bacterium]
MNWQHHPWAGVFAATLCPFHINESIDEEGLVAYMQELAAVDGIEGVVCNGHTGEIMSLRHSERAEVTRVTAKAAGQKVKVISGVSGEGSVDAIDQALAAKEVGADGILLMPPHHWLRFGRTPETAIGFFQDVAEGSDIPIIVHQYPAWTKAGYSLAEMLEMVKIPQVVCIKMGTRDMARWRWDYEQLKEAAPNVPILTCHDEYLLATLLEGCDGALIGFAGFVPELMVEVVHAALNGDLVGARKARKLVDPLARIVYNFGEPSGDAHQRMKCARWLIGQFPSMTMRKPLRQLPTTEVEKIRQHLELIGYECKN